MWPAIRSLTRTLVRPFKSLHKSTLSAVDDNCNHDNVVSPRRTASVIHYNTNKGSGIFNHVHGNQVTVTNVILPLDVKPRAPESIPSVIEPYQSVIKSLVDTAQLLYKLHETPSVKIIRKQLDDFIPIVACVAKTVETIRHCSPEFATHTLFSDMDIQALQYLAMLKQLNMDICEFHVHFSDLMESDLLRGILLRIFATHRWPSLSRRVEVLIRRHQAFLEKFLLLLLNPKWRQIVGDENGELRRLITSAGLYSELDLRHLAVHTIWIRDPSTSGMHPIPLSLCTSQRDLQLVMKQYFNEGLKACYPEQWEMVRINDNCVIEGTNYSDMMTPEAVFDICAILPSQVGILCTCAVCFGVERCPRCWASEDRIRTTAGWIQCRSCRAMFRVIERPLDSLGPPEIHRAGATQDYMPFHRFTIYTNNIKHIDIYLRRQTWSSTLQARDAQRPWKRLSQRLSRCLSKLTSITLPSAKLLCYNKHHEAECFDAD